MTRNLNRSSHPENSPTGDYKVGNKKPPLETRFPPGVSGNPKGRPKGSKNKKGQKHYEGIDQAILDEAHRVVEIDENGEKTSTTMLNVIVRSQVLKAAKGDTRSANAVVKNVREIERVRKEEKARFQETMINYKNWAEQEIQKCKQLGLERPKLPFDPELIFIDFEIGDVVVGQPFDRATDENIKWAKKQRMHYEEILESLNIDLRDPAKANYQDKILKYIQRCQRILDLIDKYFP